MVDALERGREAVRIALAADFAVGDDVEPGLLLQLDGDDGGVVLRLREKRLGDAPKLLRPHARRKASGEFRAVDEPFRLRVGADEGRWQKHERSSERRSTRRIEAILRKRVWYRKAARFIVSSPTETLPGVRRPLRQRVHPVNPASASLTGVPIVSLVG
ncbi:MAG TPA: hypothetical protein VMI72_00315 [Roseiarcus sp.]|nr:hypothetical protein [Roseiarcus sp.]